MEEIIVKVNNLSHRYSVQWAVQDVNFEIPARGIFGLLGSNGAGKSTLMNILCGVLKQTKGCVLVGGVDNQKDPIGLKKNIGFLPQQPPLFTDLTVEEYLYYTAQLRLMPAKEIPQAVNKVLELCGLEHFRKRLLKNLSGGYQQRVGIAQAIVHGPKLVVLDEPTNGLDPTQILEIRYLLKRIAKECAVLFSTHILSEVQETCDQVLMMNQGKVVFSGTLEAFDNYISPTTLFVTLTDLSSMEELMDIKGVKHVEELGNMSYRITFDDAQEVTDRLVEQSALRHWGMTEIRQEKSSLDEIFAELSRKR